ncbi:MAG TPA: LpqB family beta-propeller domain-containing protein [Nocardioidaceae bacterium]|jgi:hypothetical protein|nr:LpqB family beta-propeller domain-containing protein [Nocardioidaceae bacterium]
MTRRRVLITAIVGLLALLVTGCVSLPVSGGVVTAPNSEEEEQSDAPFDYAPPGPRAGDSPVAVVNGFLQAMTATPVTLQYAVKFLTEEAQNNWEPEQGTVVYGSDTAAQAGNEVDVVLGDTVSLDGRGEWLGNTTGGDPIHYQLRLHRERGEWRIANPPDVLLIPQPHFESRYQQYFLYFFEKSGQVLVPEPVYLPRGESATTMLVRGLLRGPGRKLLGTERTYLPASAELEISAPVGKDGTAEVPLSDEILDLDEDSLDRALGQLAWTLGQVPGVERMRITVGGTALDIPGRGSSLEVDGWPEYDPAVNWASHELFGIRDGHVVNLVAGDERRIAGLFGAKDYGLESIAVDLPAQKVAGVTGDGTEVLVAPRTRIPSGGASPKTAYSGGQDLLEPAWDIYGKLWLIDRAGGRASLHVVAPDGSVTRLAVDGLTGEDVSAFVLSRDGTRLVAAVDGRKSDRLVLSRVVRRADGTVRRVDPAASLPVGAIDVHEIRDLAWRTPGSVALLTGPQPGLSQVIIALIDGSSALGDVASNAELFRDEATLLVTAPAPGAALYVGTRSGQLFQLAANGRWTGTSIKRGLRSPTYVG